MPTDPLAPPHEAAPSTRSPDGAPAPLAGFSRAHWAGVCALGGACALAWSHPLWAVFPLGAFVALCFTATQFPRWSFFLPVVCHGSRAHKAVALTFDDGPDPVSTPPLLDLLARRGVKAAFFVIGAKAGRHPELIRRIAAEGHEVGNHSQHHDVLLMVRPRAVLEREIAECQRELGRHGLRPLTFRPPVGVTNPNLGGVLDRLGLFCVCFSCRPADFGNRRVKGLAQRVLSTVRGGDIVVLHDCAPAGGVGPWLAEVATVLDGLEHRGLDNLSLSQLLGRPVLGRAEGGP